MQMFWRPDFCPVSPSCHLELEPDWSKLNAVVRYCNHHRKIKDDAGLTDQQVFEAILQSSRVKERARWEAKLELGLDKENPGVPYRVEPDGNFTILTGAKGANLVAMRARIAAAVAPISKPIGTSTITVE